VARKVRLYSAQLSAFSGQEKTKSKKGDRFYSYQFSVISKQKAKANTDVTPGESCRRQFHCVEFHWADSCGTHIGGTAVLISTG